MPDYGDTLGRLASVGQMSAGIAHEVKNPLTAVKGFLQLLNETSPHRYIDLASSELERALSTLENLLQVSRPNLVGESFAPVNLCSELESLLYLFQNEMYRVHVEKNFESTEISIWGRETLIKKALFNLLKNAFEAIPNEGTIVLQHHCVGDVIRLVIEDSGVGIPEDKIKVLGTPFFSTKSNGTGMGLTQVYTTVYQHGGRLNLQSTEGVGTRFTLEFPVNRNDEAGVKKLVLHYEAGQSFKEFFLENQERFKELIAAQASDVIREVEFSNHLDKQHLFDTVVKLGNYLMEDRHHDTILLAKKHGTDWAKSELPLTLKLQWIQVFRQLYWDLLYTYYSHVDLDKDEFFNLGKKVNDMLDSFINHYFSSYMEYKNEVLRSHREIIEDLSVPVIPLSEWIAILPIVGTIDTYRAKKIQERLLDRVSTLKISRLIIDVSGVAYMDTAVVGHLFRIVDGVHLLGCSTTLTGIRPEIANTIIELGIDFANRVETKGTLQQALEDYHITV